MWCGSFENGRRLGPGAAGGEGGYNTGVFSKWLLLAVLAGVPPQEAERREDQQATEPASDEGFRIGIAVDQVFLSVNVRSYQGGFVRGLAPEDFVVLEDGVPQRIVNFYSEAVPVSVVLLIDISGSTRHTQGEIRRAALEFSRRLSPEDEVAIITFNDQPRLILNWTNDLEKIEIALESTYPKGATVLNDALYVTFDDLLRGREGKKGVILFTDGVDTGSMVSFNEALDLAVRSEAMVYVVSKLDEYWAEAIAARMQFRSRAQIVPKVLTDEYIIDVKRALERITTLTGGKVLDAQAFASLTDVYAKVAEELKNQYYISYIPSNVNKDGRWRAIEVRVNRPGVIATTRQGYYAEKREASGR